jgi:hypothetical protein
MIDRFHCNTNEVNCDDAEEEEEDWAVPGNEGAAGEEAVAEKAIKNTTFSALSGSVVVRHVEAATEEGRQTCRDCMAKKKTSIKPQTV